MEKGYFSAGLAMPMAEYSGFYKHPKAEIVSYIMNTIEFDRSVLLHSALKNGKEGRTRNQGTHGANLHTSVIPRKEKLAAAAAEAAPSEAGDTACLHLWSLYLLQLLRCC